MTQLSYGPGVRFGQCEIVRMHGGAGCHGGDVLCLTCGEGRALVNVSDLRVRFLGGVGRAECKSCAAKRTSDEQTKPPRCGGCGTEDPAEFRSHRKGGKSWCVNCARGRARNGTCPTEGCEAPAYKRRPCPGCRLIPPGSGNGTCEDCGCEVTMRQGTLPKACVDCSRLRHNARERDYAAERRARA